VLEKMRKAMRKFSVKKLENRSGKKVLGKGRESVRTK
jgi:hypothetical protein